MRVLVVGGAGYVGGAVVDELLNTNAEITVFDCLLYEETYRKDVPFVYGDIRDTSSLGLLSGLIKESDVVVWLAALVGDQACQRYPELSVAINQEPLKWLAENYKGKTIFTSSCSIYGNEGRVCTEGSAINPLSVYAETKWQAERYLSSSNAIIFRLGTLYGVGDLFSRIRLDLVVNALTVKAHEKGIIHIYGGEQFRPLLHVKDAARAIVTALQSKETGVFNLHKQNVRMKDLAVQIRNHYPELQIEFKSAQLSDQRNYAVASDKALKRFGFIPIYPIDHGIEQIKELLISGRLKDTSNPRFSNGKFLPMSAAAELETFDE